ncbi:DNA primase [Desulfomarina sp.]
MKNNSFNDDIPARIKEEADIVQIVGEVVDLKKSGVRYLGLCPFHGEKTPSFSVHGGQQFFHCFGCGESGDVFSFMMKYHNLTFPEAMKELARRYNIELPEKPQSKEAALRQKKREKLFGINKKCAKLYVRYLLEEKGAENARGYLQTRGVTSEIVEKYQLGYAPSVEREGWNYLGSKLSREEQLAAVDAGLLVRRENGGTYDRFRDRILFPIFDISGQVCGFGGRVVGDGQPKYMNSPESLVFDKSRLLLGLYQQKESIRKKKKAILVEGNFDLISLVVAGVSNVVAPLGTALTREQLRMLKRFTAEITLLFDGDSAGEKAAVRAVPFFLAEQLSGQVALLPREHDPDSFVREKGAERLLQLLDAAQSLPEFVLAALIRRHGLSLDGKSRIIDSLVPLVQAATSPLQRSMFISHFAENLGISVESFQTVMQSGQRENLLREKRVETEKTPEKTAPLSMAQKRLVEYMVLNPVHLKVLEEHGIRDALAGGLGEILFLQLKAMVEERGEFEPEELLSKLPGGQERKLVTELLMQASLRDLPESNGTDIETGSELGDMLNYLKMISLRKQSQSVKVQMKEAEHAGDMEKLQKLVLEMVEIEKKLHE